MTERIRQLLGSARAKNSVDLDFTYSLGFETKSRLLRPNQINSIVNVNDRFEEERENSTCYRLNGQLSILTDNALNGAFCTIPSDLDWAPDIINLSGQTPNTTRNWSLQVTYPSTAEIETLIKTNFDGTIRESKAGEGPQVYSIEVIDINGTNKSLIKTVQKNGFSVGEYVYIIPKNGTIDYQGFHLIEDLNGKNNSDRERNLILETNFIGNVTNGNVIRVNNLSFEDINFLDTFSSSTVTATDITGGTTNGDYTKIDSSQPFGVVVGDYVDIRTGNLGDQFNGLFRVTHTYSTGDTTNSFIIDLNSGFSVGAPTNKNLEFRRLDGVPSIYYIRKFKVLTELKDYEVYKAGFSTNIFPDDISNRNFLFHFNQDINIENLRDNLDRPLSELYLTVIKRAGSKTYNFSSVKATFEENREVVINDDPLNIETISNWTLNDNGTVEKDLDDEYYGDYVEYDVFNLREISLSQIIHRFAPIRVKDGVYDNGNGEGYYYLPHNKIQIRVFSDVLEVEDDLENTIFPDYAKNYINNTVAWRDLLSIGFFEEGINGVDYPFLNGCHYIYQNYPIYVRRQRPPRFVDISVRTTESISPDQFQDVC